MTSLQPHKLVTKVLVKSKAKFLKFIPMRSIVEGEKYQISFKIENIGEDVFPGGEFIFRVDWPSRQSTWIEDIQIPALSRNESYETDKATPDAFSDGYGLIFVDRHDVKREQNKPRVVEFYSRKEEKIPIDINKNSISGIKSRSWEEIYEFWAMIFAATGLVIIALEKIAIWLTSIV